MKFLPIVLRLCLLLPAVGLCLNSVQAADKKKPNILVLWGNDIGQFNISAINRGMMGYKIPNIDRIASEGAYFTDWYGQQSCTSSRAVGSLCRPIDSKSQGLSPSPASRQLQSNCVMEAVTNIQD